MKCFFEIGKIYKSLKKHDFLFSTEPYMTDYKPIFHAPGESIFTVLDAKTRYAQIKDEMLYTANKDKPLIIWQIQILYDNKVCYLCYLPQSDVGKNPNNWFAEILT